MFNLCFALYSISSSLEDNRGNGFYMLLSSTFFFLLFIKIWQRIKLFASFFLKRKQKCRTREFQMTWLEVLPVFYIHLLFIYSFIKFSSGQTFGKTLLNFCWLIRILDSQSVKKCCAFCTFSRKTLKNNEHFVTRCLHCTLILRGSLSIISGLHFICDEQWKWCWNKLLLLFCIFRWW